jgi:hypothetical protein
MCLLISLLAAPVVMKGMCDRAAQGCSASAISLM